MTTLKTGDRVRHAQQPDWGVGKILSIGPEDKVRVRFVNAGEKLFRNAPLETVTGAEADDPRLNEGTTSRSKARSKTPARKDAPLPTLPELITKFRGIFPQAFEDPEYFRRERSGKQAAHELMNELFGREPLAALLAASEFEEVKTRAMRAVDSTDLLFSLEKVKLREALSDPVHAGEFASALSTMLGADAGDESEFDAWADTLRRIGAGPWTTATYFLFLADPLRHLFVKPKATQEVAAAMGFELSYRPQVNGPTYRRVQEFAERLRSEIAELGPRDLIDVQSFIWCVAAPDY